MKRFRKKFLPLLFAFTLCVSVLSAGVGLKSAVAGQTDASVLRVSLSTMKNLTTIKITVNGVYSLQDIQNTNYSFRNGVRLTKGTAYTLGVKNKIIYITNETGEYPLGSSVTLYSHTADRNSYLTMKNPSNGTCNYIGNMKLSVNSSGYLSFVNELNIEDYVCGVVPYEMSEGQQIESLKVQAVCARSYANRLLQSNPNATSHLNDTDQVYRGYNPNYVKCINAVDQTSGEVLTYNGAYISTYYSATNGGITDDNHNVWGSTKLPYYNVKVDPYDTSSRNVLYYVSKRSPSATVKNNVIESAADLLSTSTYDVSTVEFVSINSVKPTYNSVPTSVAQTERRVISAVIGVTVNVKKKSTNTYVNVNLSIEKKYEKVRNFFGLPSQKFRVEDNGTQIVFSCDGRGHGIGMSQIGTYGRVKAGQLYDEILAFYYEGTKIKTLQYASYVYKPIPASVNSDSQLIGMVKAPVGLSGTVKTTADYYSKPSALEQSNGALVVGTSVAVLERGTDWYKVSFNDGANTAYVLKKDVVIVSGQEEYYDNEVLRVGVVAETSKLRSAPVADGNHDIKNLEVGTKLLVIEKSGDAFYKVYYDGVKRYVSCSGVTLTDVGIKPVYNGTVTAYRAAVLSECSETADKIGVISKNESIRAFEADSEYVGVNYNGTYCFAKSGAVELDKSAVVDYVIPQSKAEKVLTGRTVSATKNKMLYSDTKLSESASVWKKGTEAVLVGISDSAVAVLYDGRIYYTDKTSILL